MKKAVACAAAVLMSAVMCVPAMAGETEAAAPSGKKYVIATDTVFKPFEYTDDKGDFVGIDVDILAAIAKDQGFDGFRDRGLPGWAGGRYDRRRIHHR